MLVAVVTKTLALNKGEKHVHFFMLDIQISKRVRAKSDNILQKYIIMLKYTLCKHCNILKGRRWQLTDLWFVLCSSFFIRSVTFGFTSMAIFTGFCCFLSSDKYFFQEDTSIIFCAVSAHSLQIMHTLLYCKLCFRTSWTVVDFGMNLPINFCMKTSQ